MSEDKVQIARAFADAITARDIEALISVSDPSIEFHSTFAVIGGGIYHGHDGLRSWYRDLEETWGEGIRSELEAVFDIGEHAALAFNTVHGRGRQSGVEVTLPIASVARLRDGRVVYLKAYAHREDALKELGMSEDALERIGP